MVLEYEQVSMIFSLCFVVTLVAISFVLFNRYGGSVDLLCDIT